MAVFDDFDVTKIDPNLMRFFRSAEFAELVHQASDLGVGSLAQHHNLGLTAVDAAPGDYAKKLNTDLSSLETDVTDLSDLLDDTILDVADNTADIAALGNEWFDTGLNTLVNPSFLVWDGSTGDLTHFPDGNPEHWGAFWRTGTQGVLSRDTAHAKDGSCLKWTTVGSSAATQNVYTEPFFLASADRLTPIGIVVWARSDDDTNPIQLAIDSYSANHSAPAPFDGTTTPQSLLATTTINHEDWRPYTAWLDPLGLTYHSIHFRLIQPAGSGQIGYIDQAFAGNKHIDVEALRVDDGSGMIPYGFDHVGGGGSKGYAVTASPDSLTSTPTVPVLKGPIAGDPFWDYLDVGDIYVGAGADGPTLEDFINYIDYDSGTITSNTGFTLSSGWTNLSVTYRWRRLGVNGKLVSLYITCDKSSSAITNNAAGNPGNVNVLDAIPSAITPDVAAYWHSGAAGRLAAGTIGTGGVVNIAAMGGTSNLAVGEGISIYAVYPVFT